MDEIMMWRSLCWSNRFNEPQREVMKKNNLRVIRGEGGKIFNGDNTRELPIFCQRAGEGKALTGEDLAAVPDIAKLVL